MSKSSPLRIAFLDVGHGYTIIISIIEDGIKRAIIIDCNDAIKTKNYILDNEIQVVDYILITHLHQDHYKGINMLIDSLMKNGIEIKNVCWEKDKYLRSDEEQRSKYNMFTKRLYEYHTNSRINYVAKRFDDKKYRRLDNKVLNDFKAKIIYPNSFIANYFDDRNVNNTSAVVQIEYKEFKIILPGDLEGEGWYFLKQNFDDLKCNILKMPHHGGYFKGKAHELSTSEVIDNTDPEFAVISTGQNEKYKHPSKETIEYLASENINILCTEVTDLCDKNRLDKKECIISKLGIKYKGSSINCPCAGNIIFEIDDEIKLVSHNYLELNEVRDDFEDRTCINLQ